MVRSHLFSPKISCTFAQRNTGCSSVRLECASGGREVAGSNPVIPTKVVKTYCESSSYTWAALVAFRRYGKTHYNRSFKELHMSNKGGIDEVTICNVSPHAL